MLSKPYDIISCMAQFLLCVGGGFWAGFQAEPQSVATSGAGALGMGGALFLSWGAAAWLGMTVGSLQLLRQVSRRLAKHPGDRTAQAASDDRFLRTATHWIAGLAMVALSPLVAVLVWGLSSHGDFIAALLRCLLVGVAAALLMPRALRAVHG